MLKMDHFMMDDNKNELIKIPPNVCIESLRNPIDSIVKAVYPAFLQKYNDPIYLKERAILTLKNKMMYELNKTIMKMIPEEGRHILALKMFAKQV